MSQKSSFTSKHIIRVKESNDARDIEEVLEKILHVPDNRLKPAIIQKLIDYLTMKFIDNTYKIKVFITYAGVEPNGFVICQIDTHYRSYGRKSGTFGWLHAKNFAACKMLIKECESFVRENKIRKLRGPINFPKGLGGIGVQFKGFEHRMMYGVAFGDPNSEVLDHLNKLGYKSDSEYTCMRVTKET